VIFRLPQPCHLQFGIKIVSHSDYTIIGGWYFGALAAFALKLLIRLYLCRIWTKSMLPLPSKRRECGMEVVTYLFLPDVVG